MPVPSEYQQIKDNLYDFLLNVRDSAELGSTHQAYTVAQSVFRVYRRRLTTVQAISFSNILPAGIRALFVAEWDPVEYMPESWQNEDILKELKLLRPYHNYSDENSVKAVAEALWLNTEHEKLENVLVQLPSQAGQFWLQYKKPASDKKPGRHETWQLPGHVTW